MASSTNVVCNQVSGYPHTNLSFMLKLFAPIRHLEAINDSSTRENIRSQILKDYPINKHIYHEFSGRTFEGIMCPHFYNYTKEDVGIPMDFTEVQGLVSKIALNNDDWMYAVQKKLSIQNADITWMIVTANKLVGHDENEDGKDIQFLLDDKGCVPGCTRLKIVNPQLTDSDLKVKLKRKSSKSDDYYLSSSALLEDTKVDLVKRRQYLKDLLTTISETGQKGTTFDISSIDQYLENNTKVQISIALPCLSWPIVAQKWKSRERKSGWPNRSLIAKVLKEGVLISPPGNHGNQSLEWEINFSAAERILAESLSSVQKQVLVLLHFVVFFHFNEAAPHTLDFHHLKTVLFWVCENIPPLHWNSENTGKCFSAVLEKLTTFVESGVLPDYFIPEKNILNISKLKSSDKKQMVKVLKDIRTDPIKHLSDFTELYQLVYIPSTREMKDILIDIRGIKVTTKKDIVDEPVCLAKQKHVFDQLALQHMKEHAYKEAIYLYKEYSTMFKDGDNFEPEYKVMSVVSGMQNTNLLMVYNLLWETFPDSNHKLEILSNLGKEYQKAYFNSRDPSKSNHYREKAEECFLCAITLPDCTLQIKAEYGLFLKSTKQYQMALQILENILESEDALMCETANAYSKIDVKYVDSIIQTVLVKYTNFVVPSFALGHYIVTSCHQKIGNHEQAQVSLMKFKLACDQLGYSALWNSSSVKKCMFTLLGCLADEMGVHDLAGESFRKADENC